MSDITKLSSYVVTKDPSATVSKLSAYVVSKEASVLGALRRRIVNFITS